MDWLRTGLRRAVGAEVQAGIDLGACLAENV